MQRINEDIKNGNFKQIYLLRRGTLSEKPVHDPSA